MITQWWGVAAGEAGVAAAGEAAEVVAVAVREGRRGSCGRPVPVPPVSEPLRGRRAAAAAAAAAEGALSARRGWARGGGVGLGGMAGAAEARSGCPGAGLGVPWLEETRNGGWTLIRAREAAADGEA